jgi:hypothetical protein
MILARGRVTVIRKAHNLETLVRIQAPQPRKTKSILKGCFLSRGAATGMRSILRESRDEIYYFILRDHFPGGEPRDEQSEFFGAGVFCDEDVFLHNT